MTLDDAKRAAQRLWGQGLLTVIVGRAPQAAAEPAAATAGAHGKLNGTECPQTAVILRSAPFARASKDVLPPQADQTRLVGCKPAYLLTAIT